MKFGKCRQNEKRQFHSKKLLRECNSPLKPHKNPTAPRAAADEVHKLLFIIYKFLGGTPQSLGSNRPLADEPRRRNMTTAAQ